MARGQLPVLSLDAVTGDTTGAVNDLGDTLGSHAVVVTISGHTGTAGIETYLDISLDDVNWVNLASTIHNVDGIFTATGSFPGRYVRARVVFEGTATATVTAWVAST